MDETLDKTRRLEKTPEGMLFRILIFNEPDEDARKAGFLGYTLKYQLRDDLKGTLWEAVMEKCAAAVDETIKRELGVGDEERFDKYHQKYV